MNAPERSNCFLLDEDTGGFKPTLWSGSRSAFITQLLSLTPANSLSPTMQGLLRRVVLTPAEPPRGDDDLPFLRARIDRLFASGDLKNLQELFANLPDEIDDQGLVRQRIDAALLTDNMVDACETASQANLKYDGTYWMKVIALCRAYEGSRDSAEFAIDVLEEMGEDDPLYYSLLRAVPGLADPRVETSIRTTEETVLTPLIVAMYRLSERAIPEELLERSPPAALAAVAQLSGQSNELRVAAGEAAARKGALSPGTLAALYQFPIYSEDEIAGAPGDDGAPGSLLYQAALQLGTSEEREVLLTRSLERWDMPGGFVYASQVHAQIVNSLSPAPVLLGSAPLLARASISRGDNRRAFAWYNLLRSAASQQDAEATTDLISLWPVMHLSVGSQQMPWSTEILDVWWQAQAVHPSEEKERRGTMAFTAFEAVGRNVPGQYWLELMDNAELRSFNLPGLAFQRSLLNAANNRRVGETVLLALINLGPEGPSSASPATLAAVAQAPVV